MFEYILIPPSLDSGIISGTLAADEESEARHYTVTAANDGGRSTCAIAMAVAIAVVPPCPFHIPEAPRLADLWAEDGYPVCAYAIPHVVRATDPSVTSFVGFERAEFIPASGAVRLHLPYVCMAGAGQWYRVHGGSGTNPHGLRALRHLAHVLGAAPVGLKQVDGWYGKQYGDAAQAALPQMYYDGSRGTDQAPGLDLTYCAAGEQCDDLPYVDLQF